MGAERLLGNGDMLFLSPGTSQILRGQGTFVSDDEIGGVMGAIGTSEPQYAAELVNLQPAGAEEAPGKKADDPRDKDDLYEAAVEVIIREGRGSVSLLQRALGVGYGRGARLIDFMAEDGVVGEYKGSQAREVLLTMEEWAARTGSQPLPPDPPPRSKLRIKPHAEEQASLAVEDEEDEETEDWEDDDSDEESLETDESADADWEEEAEDETFEDDDEDR
jgi:DNA segregation ATPase FtsK/SpoIIIE, S-DNA-T family